MIFSVFCTKKKANSENTKHLGWKKIFGENSSFFFLYAKSNLIDTYDWHLYFFSKITIKYMQAYKGGNLEIPMIC